MRGEQADFRRIFPNNFLSTKTTIEEQFSYKASDELGVGRMFGFYEPITTGLHRFYVYGMCKVNFYASINVDDYNNADFNQDPQEKVGPYTAYCTCTIVYNNNIII